MGGMDGYVLTGSKMSAYNQNTRESPYLRQEVCDSETVYDISHLIHCSTHCGDICWLQCTCTATIANSDYPSIDNDHTCSSTYANAHTQPHSCRANSQAYSHSNPNSCTYPKGARNPTTYPARCTQHPAATRRCLA